MRIVAGSHRGRTLQAPPGGAVRPTADRTREALFNILVHARWSDEPESPIVGAVVLDAFCGSGALGLEALSRGAAACTFMDVSAAALDFARRNVALFDEDHRAALLRADATRPPRARRPVTLAFLDPPYGQELASPALVALAAQGWLASGAVVVVETADRDAFACPHTFDPLDERTYRATKVSFLKYRGAGS